MISLAKARIIAGATAVLDDARAAMAETLIADQLAGKTPGQIAAMIARAVVKVDPEGARKRRERAQKEDAPPPAPSRPKLHPPAAARVTGTGQPARPGTLDPGMARGWPRTSR